MNDQLKTFLRGLLHALTDLRMNARDGDGSAHDWAKWGSIDGRIWLAVDLDLITLDQAYALQDLRLNASEHRGKPFPHKANVGPVMPFSVAFERRQAAAQPSFVEPQAQVPAVIPMGGYDFVDAKPLPVAQKPIRRAVTAYCREVSSGWDQPTWEVILSCGHSAVARGVKGFRPRTARCSDCEALRVKPQAQVPADEPRPVSAPTPRSGLRLLCLLVKGRNGETRSLPIHTLHPVPPRNRHHGKWTVDRYACFVLRETHAKPASAEVLARCARHRQAYAIRPALGSVRAGGLSHV